jgi:hypothetical protein
MFDGLSVDGLLDMLNSMDSCLTDRPSTDRLSTDCGGTSKKYNNQLTKLLFIFFLQKNFELSVKVFM